MIANKYAYLVQKVMAVPTKSKLQPMASLRLSKTSLIQNELAHLQSPLNFYEKL
ncbi:MAG: hypothetical protein MUE72_14485 [Chitinophagaceae bacterium]|nr:hypothetical protein [Chitinophagaceae bacterium]